MTDEAKLTINLRPEYEIDPTDRLELNFFFATYQCSLAESGRIFAFEFLIMLEASQRRKTTETEPFCRLNLLPRNIFISECKAGSTHLETQSGFRSEFRALLFELRTSCPHERKRF